MSIINWTNVTSLNDFVSVPNTLTGGHFWNVITYLVGLVIVITLSNNYGIVGSLFAGAFVTFVVGLMLFIVGLVSWQIVLAPAIACIIALILYKVYGD